jgi:site-specific DNA-cytosine methylase
MKTVELFCGVGLSSIGIVKAGAELVGAIDIQPIFIKAFNAQSLLPPVGKAGDVNTFDIPECDLMSAGPVCKAFSPGATVFGTQGSEDDRNTFPHFLKAVERARPKYLLIENSFGLQRFKGYIQEILDKLTGYGYKVNWGEIDCYDYGVPQHRRRLVFLGSPDGRWAITKPEKRQGPATVGDCLYTPPQGESLTRCMTEGELRYWNRDPRHAKKHPPLKEDRPASTVVSNYKRGVPYGAVEKSDGLHMCEPRLAARLQGVPDEYSINVISRTRMLEGIGNGFPPPVVEHLVRSLLT